MKNHLFSRASMLAIGLAVVVTTPALAQTPAAEVDAGDIIVTATREKTLLSKTPIAITAITGEDLRAKGIVGPTGLAESVPNLSIDRTNGLQITIRGVSSTDGTEKGDPSAAFLLDGIYLARPQQADVGFFDVNHVEVLRGPQGTLYGRNTTAGVVNVITNKPEIGAFSAGANFGYGNYNSLNADAFVNIPAGDSVAFRLSGTYDQRDALIRPMAGDRLSLNPFRKNYAFRAQAYFKLGDNGDLLLRGSYGSLAGSRFTGAPTSNFFDLSHTDPLGNTVAQYSPIAGGNNALVTRNLMLLPVNGVPLGRAAGAPDPSRPAYVDDKSYGIDGELNYDFGGVKATYIGSYRKYKAKENAALDIYGLLPGNLPPFLSALMVNYNKDCPSGRCSYPAFFDGDYKQTSHELRFAIGGDGPFKVQLGGYYFREESTIGFWIIDFPEFIIGNNKLYGFPQHTISSTKAGFAQATLKIGDSIRLTAGGRYTDDDKFRYGHTVATNNITAPIVIGGSTYANDAQIKKKKFTWRAGFDADVLGGLVYGSVATGYKQGGFGDGCSTGGTTKVTSAGERCLPTDPQAIYYDAETLTAYELGFRGKVATGVRIDATVFYYDYKNLQLSSQLNINGAPTLVTTNAGKASVKGLELEAVLNPAQNHQVTLGMNLLDSHYTKFCPGINAAGACIFDFAGRKLDRSPSQVLYARYDWTIPVGEGNIVASAGTKLTSSYAVTQFGAAPVQYFTPSHSNTSLSLTYSAPESRWYVAAFAKNLENFLEIRSATSDAVTPGDPRTYGIRAGFKF